MTRRPMGGGRPPGAGGGKNMMRQIQEMQERMLEEQKALGDETEEVSVGGGAVKVVMNGHQKLQSVSIEPALLDPDEAEMLGELLVAAVNQAVERTQALASERMNAITGSVSLPGIGGLGGS